MSNLKLEFNNNYEIKLEDYTSIIKKINDNLILKSTDDNDFIGWLNIDSINTKEEITKMINVSKKIINNSEVFIVIGAGGSSLGSKAIIKSLANSFGKGKPEIIYVGDNLSTSYINELIEYIKDKDYSLNVISKSGSTTEPAIAFRIFKKLLEEKYGKEESKDRIVVTTDEKDGYLRKIAELEGYETFNIPKNIGGRYSVLSPVGLFPIAVAGLSIEDLLSGAKNAELNYNEEDINKNECFKYAIIRNNMYKNNKQIEILASYDPKLKYLIEWWKQLFGESEGKDGKGIFPAGAVFTTDLHSIGQMIQDGPKNLFETIITVSKEPKDIIIESDEENLDNLNYLQGKSISYINKIAKDATIKAHLADGIPNIEINISEVNEYNIGELIYFFEKACAISCILLGVNPFDQPGVEKYKKNMFDLLGKPNI